jgi:hypothetical protein
MKIILIHPSWRPMQEVIHSTWKWANTGMKIILIHPAEAPCNRCVLQRSRGRGSESINQTATVCLLPPTSGQQTPSSSMNDLQVYKICEGLPFAHHHITPTTANILSSVEHLWLWPVFGFLVLLNSTLYYTDQCYCWWHVGREWWTSACYKNSFTFYLRVRSLNSFKKKVCWQVDQF